MLEDDLSIIFVLGNARYCVTYEIRLVQYFEYIHIEIKNYPLLASIVITIRPSVSLVFSNYVHKIWAPKGTKMIDPPWCKSVK